MPLLLALYGVGRFALEFARGDQGITATGLTVGQNVSLLLFFLFAPAFLFLYLQSRKSFRAA